MEPQWSKSIKSETVCDYYYYLFVIICIIVVVQLVSMIGSFLYIKKNDFMSYVVLLLYLLTMGLGIVNALFLYLICTRGLLKEEPKKQQ
jgi:hypothetical protein